MHLPKSINLGHFEIFIKELDPEIAAASSEEGSFLPTSRTIWIDKSLIEKGGADLVCVLIHELMHVSFLKNNFNQTSTEEDLVNGFSNDMTELLSRTELLNIITKILRGTNGKNRPKK